MFNRIIALVKKEFLAVLKDPKSRAVVFLPPIVQLLVFGYAATFDLNHIPFAVYNESPSAAARELAARFRHSPHFHEVAQIEYAGQVAPLIDRRDALMVLHLGPRFGRDLRTARPAPAQVILDGRDSNTALLTLGYADTIINEFNTWWLARHGGAAPPAHLEVRSWFNPNLLSRWFFVPGIVALLTLVVAILVTALSVAREREQGTFDQLLVTPFRPWEILIGKTLPGFFIGLFEASLILLVAIFWFKVPFLGRLVTFYAGLLLFLLSVIGVGLTISSLSVTQQQGLLGAFLFVVPAVILSGFATPIANMPRVIQYITYINPVRYFLVIVRGVFLEGTPLALCWPQLWPMALIAAATLTTAAWLFRRRMY